MDIVAIREGKILLVECKTGKHPSIAPKQLSRILEISKTVGAIPVLAVRKKHREIKLFKMMEPGLGGTGLKAVSQVDG